MKRLALLLCLAVLAGCVGTYPAPAPTGPLPDETLPLAEPGGRVGSDLAARNFVSVVSRMEPVIEDQCRARSPGLNCNFRIVVDDRPGMPPNAFQTIDSQQRPIIAFTVPLIADARNVDELAFIMGHEAAHHIRNHLARQQDSANLGAILIGGIAASQGADDEGIRNAQSIGATLGARRYSKEFELEADALGAVIARNAGYDPLRGVAFFMRIPDPGNRFLGTHPPNSDRVDTVRRALAVGA